MAECRPGCIVFIKAPEQVKDTHVFESCVPLGVLDHPALVLEASKPNYVLICPVSLSSVYD